MLSFVASEISLVIEKILLSNSRVFAECLDIKSIRIILFKYTLNPHVYRESVIFFKRKEHRTSGDLRPYTLYREKLTLDCISIKCKKRFKLKSFFAYRKGGIVYDSAMNENKESEGEVV